MWLRRAGGIGAVGALALGAGAYATLYPQSQLCGPVLVAPRRPGEIALTFDDGPNPAATPQMLSLLAKFGVRAAFYVIGDFARRSPGLLREVVAEGHAVGSHTMTHPWLPWQTDERIWRELVDGRDAIEQVTGEPVRMFRSPHGARRPYVLRLTRAMGMQTVHWNVIANDWKPDAAGVIADRVERGVERAFARGRAANVVLHDGGHTALGMDRTRTIEATRLVLQRHPVEAFVRVDAWL